MGGSEGGGIKIRVVLLTSVTLLNVAILKHISIRSPINYCKSTTAQEFILTAVNLLCSSHFYSIVTVILNEKQQ